MSYLNCALAHFLLESAWKNKHIGHYVLASEVCVCIEKGVEGEGEGARWGKGGGMGRSERREKEEANSGSRYMYVCVGMVKIY